MQRINHLPKRVDQLRRKQIVCSTRREFSCTGINRKQKEDSITLMNKAVYPPILDTSPREVFKRNQEDYYNQIKALNSVEEKLFAVNLPRYYGWPALTIKEGEIPYDFLSFAQHVTRTHLYETDKLPVFLSTQRKDNLLQKVKKQLEKAILFENQNRVFKYEINNNEEDLSELEINKIRSTGAINQINRIMLNALSAECPHLLQAQVDYNPRMESFWRVGGFYPTTEDIELRKSKKVDESMLEDPIDRCIQYFGSPVIQLRHSLPLLPLSEINFESLSNEVENKTKESKNKPYTEYPLAEYRYDPRVYHGIEHERQYATTIPGFWPNDPHQFGLLSYHTRDHINERPSTFGEVDSLEAIHSQAILASFAWLLGQACYQGFSFYYDITYPFVTQTILTDGRLFSFYNYQLNTTVIHSDYVDESNPLRNTCYGTPTQELYHNIEDNKIIGWNDDVLSNLLSLYLNKPAERKGVDLIPYLNKEHRLLSYMEDNKARNWIHNQFRYIMTRRPRWKGAPEIYDWERIFKVDFQKRPLDSKKRFFEIGEDPLNDKKYTDHTPKLIPKKYMMKYADDPNRVSNKERRFEDTYYPKAQQNYTDVV